MPRWSLACVPLALVLACGSSESGAGTPSSAGTGASSSIASSAASSGSGVGAGGAGAQGGEADGSGGDAWPQPGSITEPDKCVYSGTAQGGGGPYLCRSVDLALSEPVPLSGLVVKVETSLGDVFTDPCLWGVQGGCTSADRSLPLLAVDADPATKLFITAGENPGWYAPTWIHVELGVDGSVIADTLIEDIEYACQAEYVDVWCWKPLPLPVTVTLP